MAGPLGPRAPPGWPGSPGDGSAGPSGRTARRTRPRGRSSPCPGRSLATTGTPAAIASKSLFGVVRRWFRVEGWIGIATTSAAGDPREQLLGRDRRQDVDPAAGLGSRPRAAQLRLEGAVAHQHEDGVGRRRDRVDQLLDPAVRAEAALVQHDGVRRIEAQALVEPASRGSGGSKR